jgi:CheY-like chemotaxis protein
MMMFDLVARSTTLARTGASPVQCAESLSFDAIFTDIEPPDATGDNLCREPVSCTRGVAQTPLTVFGAQTAWGSPGRRAPSRDAGFEFQAAQPMTIEALKKLFAEMGSSRARTP